MPPAEALEVEAPDVEVLQSSIADPRRHLCDPSAFRGGVALASGAVVLLLAGAGWHSGAPTGPTTTEDETSFSETSIYTANIGRYPGYAGGLHVAGSASVVQSGEDVRLSWHLSGLEAELCAVPPEGIPNACGIHIHEGSTCDDSSNVGGHFYDREQLEADPWPPVVYTPDAIGDSLSAGRTVAIRKSLSDVFGRAVVVHDHAGGRVACGVIQPPGQDFAMVSLQRYPGYAGVSHVGGTISVLGWGDDVALSWSLTGLNSTHCNMPPDGVANACGIHIHSGLTCENASLVGGHFYNAAALDTDPWSDVVFRPDSASRSVSLGQRVQLGRPLADVFGRTVVVHDHTGDRVACGVIHAPGEEVAVVSLQRYPGYGGDAAVTGTVNVIGWEQTGQLSLSWYLRGLEPQLCHPAPADVANACGIHVHEGHSCDDAFAVGGHFYDRAALAADPWRAVVYQPNARGESVDFVNRIGVGRDASGILERTVVVHDHTGARAACGVISPWEVEHVQI